jgi:acyl transferase domain-containing protein
MPGDVRSPSDLWKLLMSKKVANTEKVPPSRFNIDAYLHANNDRPGSFNIPGGYFLEDDIEMFDPAFFGISPVEATWMDPQHKKLLEVAYEAIENSGTTLEDLTGANTGCYIGCFSNDYQQMTIKEPDFKHIYATSGIDAGLLANRVSYVFDLKGPRYCTCIPSSFSVLVATNKHDSVTINTACSSTLYAVDLACKAIHSGQCESAIVGGTNLILTVDQHMNTAKLNVLSPTNQCHTFDESADGYGRADGFGALFLKPFSAAVRDGSPIRAVIRSTASNR